MGLTFLSKETSIVLLGGLYAFLALTPELGARLRDLAVALALMALVVAPFPLSLMLAGRTGTGESYLTWQLFRRPNHDWLFYPQTVPEVIGPLVLLAAAHGAVAAAPRGLVAGAAAPVLDRRAGRLLPALARQGLPVPAPDRAGDRRARRPRPERALGLAPRARRARHRHRGPEPADPGLDPDRGLRTRARRWPGRAGSRVGARPGRWIDANVPAGATLMTIGPSMANLVQLLRPPPRVRAIGQPQPAEPEPVVRAARQPRPGAARQRDPVRRLGRLLGAAARPKFSRRLLRYAARYDGRVVHSELLPARGSTGLTARRPAIVVFEVRP